MRVAEGVGVGGGGGGGGAAGGEGEGGWGGGCRERRCGGCGGEVGRGVDGGVLCYLGRWGGGFCEGVVADDGVEAWVDEILKAQTFLVGSCYLTPLISNIQSIQL